MSCILTIRGQNLDVNTFIQQSKLEPYKTFHRGEPRLRTKPDGEKHQFSGLSICTSTADFDKLQEQIQDTITFLRANKEKLRLISEANEVEYAVIDFGVELQIDKSRVRCVDLAGQ